MNMNDGVITGKAMWCHLADTETFNGTDTNKFSITLVPSVEDMNNLMQEAQTIWEEFKETLKNMTRLSPSLMVLNVLSLGKSRVLLGMVVLLL